MENNLSCCGLNCTTCIIHLATQENDEENKRKMRIDIARQIKEHYGQDCKPEDVTNCDGCKAENGRLFSGSNNCKIRQCAKEKGIENCAYCNKYACNKLQEFFVNDPQAKKKLDAIRNTL